MGLTVKVAKHNGRPMLFINGEPTTEFWSYGDPNAIDDFVQSGLRICQFHVPMPSWWTGPGQYDFAPTDAKIDEFLARQPDTLLMPRVNFGYEGEGWWAAQHPDELAEGRNLDNQPVNYDEVRVCPVDCWYSAGSRVWTTDAAAAMEAFVRHCEERYPDRVIGYQIGGGISAEWFRWWNFVDDTYEDYSPAAHTAFREFLKNRYANDAALQVAWGRADATLAAAEVPAPRRLHEPKAGFFRDPLAERDIIDWLECLSTGNVSQIIALCQAAKRGCDNRKIVGSFYGYFWPHHNTQNPARSGHLNLRQLLASDAIDYISSPYHYDHRMLGGFHHSETVPQVVERAGKLHLDEIDTPTHTATPGAWPCPQQDPPRNSRESCRLLQRDAAAVLGTAGVAWWMDLMHHRWYQDPHVQTEVRDLQQLAIETREWSCDSRADVALVIDDRSYAHADLHANANLYFSALPRQFEWSDLGFPFDTLMLSEFATTRPYKLYVFMNCWVVDTEQRRAIHERVRKTGMAAVWFYGAGFCEGSRQDAELISDLTGIRVYDECDPAVPEITLRDSGHPFVEQSLTVPRGAMRFGARLSTKQQKLTVAANPRGWDTPLSPWFVVDDPAATVLGDYVHDGSPGLAVLERGGWCSVYCGAPMLPGWVLRRIAESAGTHLYAPQGTQVYQRGPLLGVYRPTAGEITLSAPAGQQLSLLVPKGSQRRWRPDTTVNPAPELHLTFEPSETKFFRTGS
ncbi:MAG: beta-galactosidase [Phycisphaerae bacterium]|nr:beta-galactosidase [Phycisphaerae bacterium]